MLTVKCSLGACREFDEENFYGQSLIVFDDCCNEKDQKCISDLYILANIPPEYSLPLWWRNKEHDCALWNKWKKPKLLSARLKDYYAGVEPTIATMPDTRSTEEQMGDANLMSREMHDRVYALFGNDSKFAEWFLELAEYKLDAEDLVVDRDTNVDIKRRQLEAYLSALRTDTFKAVGVWRRDKEGRKGSEETEAARSRSCQESQGKAEASGCIYAANLLHSKICLGEKLG